MKEQDVTFFGTLLNIEPEAVKTAIEDGSLGEKVTALEMMNKTDVETLKGNLKTQVRAEHLTELEESAKKGELPQELYKPINGAVLEKLEKKLSKEYDVAEYNGIDDLVAKAISNTAKPDDTKLQEQLEKIRKLQEANTTLSEEKETAVKKANDEKNDWILNKEKSDFINQVPFDFSDVDQKELESVTAERREILKNVFDSQYNLAFKDEKVTVFKDGNPLLTDTTFEPVPISDVLQKTAAKLGLKLKSPETGGQGGQSSGSNGSQFKDIEEFEAYCRTKNIVSTSTAGIALLKKSGLKLY